MTPRERFLAALNHEEPDRVPLDLGGINTSLMIETHDNLKNHLGLGDYPAEVLSKTWQIAKTAEPILEKLSIDSQKILPFGTPDDVRREVKKRITDLAPGGGYILAGVHNLQPDISPDNITAMYEEGAKFGKTPRPLIYLEKNHEHRKSSDGRRKKARQPYCDTFRRTDHCL